MGDARWKMEYGWINGRDRWGMEDEGRRIRMRRRRMMRRRRGRSTCMCVCVCVCVCVVPKKEEDFFDS